MAGRTALRIAVLLAAFLGMMPDAGPMERLCGTAGAADRTIETASGIRTDRLSQRDLRAWRSIEAIILARDDSGRLRHPKLHSLWQWAETSDHVIYLQFMGPKDRRDNLAGGFKIEKLDPEGLKHIAVIELCLPVIKEALVKERRGPGDNFIRFEGLGRKERYAEALGHELAHAVWFLSDRRQAQLACEMDREIDFYSRRRLAEGCKAWDAPMRQHLKRLESWNNAVEKPAIATEAEVWLELLKTCRKKGKKDIRPFSGAASAGGKPRSSGTSRRRNSPCRSRGDMGVQLPIPGITHESMPG